MVGKIPWRRDRLPIPVFLGFSCGSAGKESACNAEDLGSIPGLGRSPGEGKGYLLQYSGLENSMDYIVHGVTWLSLSLSKMCILSALHTICSNLPIITIRLGLLPFYCSLCHYRVNHNKLTNIHNHTHIHVYRYTYALHIRASQMVLAVKNMSGNAGDIRDVNLIPGSGRSPRREHGNTLRILAWKIPWREEFGGLQFIGHNELDTTGVT